jgi:single-stranded DNA-binding protein
VNVSVLRGSLSRAPEVRTLPSGDHLVAYEVTVRPPGGGKADTVPVSWPDAPVSASRFDAGAEVVVVGRVVRRFFKAGGGTGSRTEVVATSVLKAGTVRAEKSVERAVEALRGAEG